MSSDQSPRSDENPRRDDAHGDERPPAGLEPRADLLLWRRVAFVLMGLQAVGLAVVALSALVILVTGSAQVARNEALLGVMLALGALGVGFVARELLRGRPRVRTAAVFWQVLLLLLVPNMWNAGSKVLAIGVLVLAVATAVAAVRATSKA